MNRRLADAPIRRKLTLLVAITSMLALVLAGVGLVGYEVVTFRRALVQKLTTVADIVGRNSTAALEFGDQSAARDVLGALDAEPSIDSGAVYRRDGSLLASYQRNHDAETLPSRATFTPGIHYESQRIVVVRPILFDREAAGLVAIQAGLDELWRRILVFSSIMLGIMAVCSLLALGLSRGLQRSITDPILDLAATARLVTSDGDFTRRATRTAQDEVGTLVDDFNRMLSEIELQDRQLRLQQERLESEVSHRTAELVAANDRLTVSVCRAQSYAEQIGQLTAIGQLLQSCHTSEEIYNVVQHAMRKLFPADSGALCVLNASGTLMEAVTTWGDSELGDRVFAPDDCWAFRLGRPHVVEPDSPLRCGHDHIKDTNTLCVPMIAQGDTLGVLHFAFPPVAEREDTATMSATRERMVMALAEQIALALANLRLREALRSQSIVDPLTGLFNRRYLEDVLERECRRAARAGRSLAVLMIDVDHFKHFNDMWGHDGGDIVLRELAALMRARFRGEDISCRYGGEEFVVLLPDATLETALERAEEFRVAVHSLTVQHRTQLAGAIAVSIGIAALPQNGFAPSSLIEAADHAMYTAKTQGRDRTVCAEATVLSTDPVALRPGTQSPQSL